MLALARTTTMALGVSGAAQPIGTAAAALLVLGKVQGRTGQDTHEDHGDKGRDVSR